MSDLNVVNKIGAEVLRLATDLLGCEPCPAELERITDARNAIFATTTKHLDEQMTPLEARIAELESRVAEFKDETEESHRRARENNYRAHRTVAASAELSGALTTIEATIKRGDWNSDPNGCLMRILSTIEAAISSYSTKLTATGMATDVVRLTADRDRWREAALRRWDRCSAPRCPNYATVRYDTYGINVFCCDGHVTASPPPSVVPHDLDDAALIREHAAARTIKEAL